MTSAITYSLVVPVYLNEENIPDLLDAVEAMSQRVAGLEAVFVVDGSPDRSFELLQASLHSRPFPSVLISHSANFGSFAAIRTGMAAARGEYLGVMAADLQEPPELVEQSFAALRAGDVDIIFGTRIGRSDPPLTRLLSHLYWSAYRRFVVRDIPKGGVDVFACTRQVSDAVLSLQETNTSLISQLFWVGFRRGFMPYERRERQKGQSSWSLRRRFRYMADSFFAFSDLPILLLVWFGVVGLVFSVILGSITLVARLLGYIDEPGFATLIVSMLFLFSVLVASQGVLGMYLWRTFENGRGKPTGIVMSLTKLAGQSDSSHGEFDETRLGGDPT